MRKARKRLSFANVMSVIAVCIALGGAAYAGTKLNGKTIKNGTIAEEEAQGERPEGAGHLPERRDQLHAGHLLQRSVRRGRLGHRGP